MMKQLILGLTLLLTLALTACAGPGGQVDGTFPNIDDGELPDVLEITVGTLGDVYFSSGLTDHEPYRSIFKVTYQETTEEDYTQLLSHYEQAATGTDEEGYLTFDWGRLLLTKGEGSLSVQALIK